MRVRFSWIKTKTFRNYAFAVVGAVAIFMLGIAAGDGRLRFHTGRANETGLPAVLDYSSVNTVYNSLRENYDGKLTEQQVIDGLKHGLASATGDPYTQYFTAAEAKQFNNDLDPTITGVGAQLEQDANGNVVVVAPLDGSPASNAGLRAKDIIISVNNQPTAGQNINTVVNKIRGKKGTQVSLAVLRGQQQMDFTITRDVVSVPTVTSKILAGNIGYMQISQFSQNSFGLAQQAVTKFQQAHVKSVILDLRDDPGGEVNAAVNIISLWLKPNTLIMQEKRGSTVVDNYYSTQNNPLLGMPTAVLLNAGSASASEITAAALHDNKAATIIGEKSYGKGVVQQVIQFGDGSELKVTVASWYRPNGQNINKKGITPDKAVKMTDDDYKNGTDPQLQAAEDFLQKQETS
jgi:carboxyl-terminal processing protease